MVLSPGTPVLQPALSCAPGLPQTPSPATAADGPSRPGTRGQIPACSISCYSSLPPCQDPLPAPGPAHPAENWSRWNGPAPARWPGVCSSGRSAGGGEVSCNKWKRLRAPARSAAAPDSLGTPDRPAERTGCQGREGAGAPAHPCTPQPYGCARAGLSRPSPSCIAFACIYTLHSNPMC